MSQPRQSRRGGRGGRGGRGAKWNKDEQNNSSSGSSIKPATTKNQNPFQSNRSIVNDNPTAPGFKVRSRSARPIPEFLSQDSKPLKSIQWRADPWDLANQQDMLKVEEQIGHGDMQSLYEKVSRDTH